MTMTSMPRTIVVDLTPVLPGGENGGAKIFVLALLRRLADLAPETRFFLLTQAVSHDELAGMDCANVSRRMVAGPSVANAVRPRLEGLLRQCLPHLPGRLRGLILGFGYKCNRILKRGGSGGLLSDLGADLLFCPFTAPTYFEPGIPTVCTIYDMQYKTFPEFFRPEDVAQRDQTFIDACCFATVLTAISNYSRKTAIHHGTLDPDRIRMIHLRMAQRVAAQPGHYPQVCERLNLTPGRYFIYPANFWQHKNHEMLLTAFGMACHTGLAPDIKLVCTGTPGPRQAYLAKAAMGLGLGKRVVFPGYLSDENFAAVLAAAHGLVFPSLYEGFGIPIIEAMAAGIPVACSNVTSLPEVAADAAIFFDPRIPTQIADAITTLAGDDPTRIRLINAGRRRAVEFADSDRMVREYWDLFLYAMNKK